MGFEDASRSASEPEPKADAPASAPVAPTTDAAQAKKEKERAEEAARGRLRRAQAKLKEAKDETSLKKLAAELAGTTPPPSGAVVKLAPTLTPEKLAAELHKALKPNAPLLALVAQGKEDTWADACRVLSAAIDGEQGKALCEGWAPLLCMLFPNGLESPYAAAIVSTIVFSLGVGVQTAVVRMQRSDAKKATT